jgi:hypothetical protein
VAPHPLGLGGLEGFLHHFIVTFRANDGYLDIEPQPQPQRTSRPSAAYVSAGCQSCAAVQEDNANGNSMGLASGRRPRAWRARGVDGEQNGEQASGDIRPCPATYSD